MPATDDREAALVLPVRFEAAELPQSWIFRKYVCVVWGVAHEESSPPKKVLQIKST